MQKWAVMLSRYSKASISFVAITTASVILFFVSYFIIGLPEIDSGFWTVVLVTGAINIITFPLMLKAYEVGEFSSVYSMILLTPVFLILTSFVFLGEAPSSVGALGIILTVFGLYVIAKSNRGDHTAVPDFRKGNLLGITVAFLWSISVNFDKLSVVYSDVFFAPAVILAMMSAGYAAYLLIKYRTILVKVANANVTPPAPGHKFVVSGLAIMVALGLAMSLSQVFHNSALITGLASYTIAIKRLGVLFGVFWGWLFFHEKNNAKKFLGTTIAILGVIAILLS